MKKAKVKDRQKQNNQKIRILIVCSDKYHLAGLACILRTKNHVDISWVSDGKTALKTINGDPFDLVIADDRLSDMTGLRFIQKLVTVNPVINSALVSQLSREKFHEKSEGSGILAKLPAKLDEDHATDLLNKLHRILL